MNTANRVAINTIVQYTRLILNLIIALVSVRIILNALGASDYGVYDVVGGVIALLGFLNSSLSQTSIRYLSVSLGKNNLSILRETFNNSFWLHFLISALIVIALEIVGVFIFDGFLNIPSNRIYAAKVIYHCMVATTFFQIVVTPFQALIISHEKFVYTSVVAILDSVLKLMIAIVLTITTEDKLIVYGVLMAIVTVLNVALYISYLLLKYRHELYIGMPHVKGIKRQSSFAGWTVMDIMGSMLNRQGYAIMLNKFFGTTVNATFAIARQIEGQIYCVSAAVIDTMKPQIMKSYGANDVERMFRLSMTAGKLGFTMMSIVCIPLLVYMPEVLALWLVKVPAGTETVARLLVCACMMIQITQGLVYANQATGKIKWFSIIVSVVRVMALPLSVVFCLIGCPVEVAMVTYFVCETLASFSRVLVMSKVHGMDIMLFYKECFIKIVPPFLISIMVCYVLKMLTSGLLCLLLVSAFTGIVYLVLSYFIGLSDFEKQITKGIVSSVKKRL